MKEFAEGVKTKAEADYEKWKDYLIDKDGDYICSVCKRVWYPTMEKDVNQKRPSVFCKLCSGCRMKSYLKAREYKQKKGNNYDKNRDASNNQTALAEYPDAE